MTPAEAAAFRKGLEAGAREADRLAATYRAATVFVLSEYIAGRSAAAADIAAAIRALPVPESSEPTEAEVERALDAYWLTPTWRNNSDIAKGQRMAMRAAIRAARGQP